MAKLPVSLRGGITAGNSNFIGVVNKPARPGVYADMYCVRCGKGMEEPERFCSACGKPVREIPLMPREGRIAGHIRLLGIFWIALSSLRLLPALVLAAILSGDSDFPPGAPPFVRPLLMGVSSFLFLGGLLGFLTGAGLLKRARWARMFAIVLGCVGLIDAPLGSAAGIYTMWVLLPAQSEEEYQKISAGSRLPVSVE